MKDNLREVKVNFVLLNMKLLQQETAFSLEADFWPNIHGGAFLRKYLTS